jgi:hypothetical protein
VQIKHNGLLELGAMEGNWPGNSDRSYREGLLAQAARVAWRCCTSTINTLAARFASSQPRAAGVIGASPGHDLGASPRTPGLTLRKSSGLALLAQPLARGDTAKRDMMPGGVA